jgi:hypothetical protein
MKDSNSNLQKSRLRYAASGDNLELKTRPWPGTVYGRLNVNMV